MPPLPLAIVLRATDVCIHVLPYSTFAVHSVVGVLCPAFGTHEYSRHEGERTVQWIGNCLQPDASTPPSHAPPPTPNAPSLHTPLKDHWNGVEVRQRCSLPGVCLTRSAKRLHKKRQWWMKFTHVPAMALLAICLVLFLTEIAMELYEEKTPYCWEKCVYVCPSWATCLVLFYGKIGKREKLYKKTLSRLRE